MSMFNFLKKRNPIFIFGCPRGGTTWLWSMMESHSATIPFLNNNNKLDGGRYSTSESGIYIKDPTNAKNIIQKFINQNNSKLVFEKTPSHTLKYDLIIKDFPNLVPLVIFRHPVSVVNSIIQSEMEAFKSYDIYSSVDLVINYYEKLVLISNNKKSKIVVYENLLEDTANNLSLLFNKLGLNTDEVSSVISENNKKSKINVKGVLRKGQVDSYKRDLSKEQLDYLNNKLSNEIRVYENFKLQ